MDALLETSNLKVSLRITCEGCSVGYWHYAFSAQLVRLYCARIFPLLCRH